MSDSLPGWRSVRVGEVLTAAQYGLSAPMNAVGRYPILRMNAIQDGIATDGQPKFVDLPETLAEQYLLQRDDVLFNRTNSAEWVGKVGLYRGCEGAVFASYLIRLLPDPARIDRVFLGRLLASPPIQARLRRYATPGVQQVNINATNVQRTLIPLPPLPEQRAIATVLDAADAAIERTRAAAAAARRLKRGLVQALLTRGIGTDGRIRDPHHQPKEFATTRLGPLPTNWTVSNVAAEFDIATGFTLNEHRRPRTNRRQYLRVANVQRGFIKLDDVAELEAGAEEFAERQLQADDLLIVEGHADPLQIGRCARVPAEAEGMTFQNHLYRLRTRGILAAFAELWLNSETAIRYWQSRCATSSGLNTINQRLLRATVDPIV